MTERPSETGVSLPTSVYLDTQFAFAYLVAEDEDHQDAAVVARRIEALAEGGSARAFVSVVVLDELAWKLGGVLYDRDAGNAQAWRHLNDPGKEREYRLRRTEIAAWLRGLLREPWISVLSADDEVCLQAAEVIAEYGLRPADACHLACAARHGVRAILTNDRHFTGLVELPVEVIAYRGQAGGR